MVVGFTTTYAITVVPITTDVITKREEKGKLQIRASNYNFGDKTTYNRINVKYICKTGYPQYRP
jgi:hypothetical protein